MQQSCLHHVETRLVFGAKLQRHRHRFGRHIVRAGRKVHVPDVNDTSGELAQHQFPSGKSESTGALGSIQSMGKGGRTCMVSPAHECQCIGADADDAGDDTDLDTLLRQVRALLNVQFEIAGQIVRAPDSREDAFGM